ncbi:MG2 domain-containing protein [Aurantibacillus circumpalustris]|uniref:MG2 domain-containing protein n=1 Tax=Aurantibacillus circumpalustris TaxID=3036359 RepID=UPI00295B42AF|nr:MG2 domain-containing protein [Aurantibacillus circumpalustris]
METTKTKKMSLLATLVAIAGLVASWLVPETFYQAALENDFIKALQKKLTAYNAHMPEDRVYIQTDKSFYEPGDDIWISGLVREGTSLKASEKSDMVYIELLNPKGTVEKKINLIANNGRVVGDFKLDAEALGGLYKIKAYTNWMKNMGDNNCFIKEIQVQDLILPNLKMKMDFEKKAFGAGDQVIAKLELNSNENKPLTNYNVKFVASVNGEKIIEQTEFTDEEGIKYIKFSLPKKLNSNDGLLNVMIDYNGSTESISRSIPIILNTIKFKMFPEGGDLVNGLDGNVAFRALNEFGKPADVEGIVVTEKGSKVASFSSFHQGMGSFKLTPQNGEKYFVKITKPEGINETFKLPEALGRGYVMNVDNSNQEEIGVSINTTESEELALVAQVRGKMYYSTVVNSIAGTNKLSFSTEKFPIGVAQITLFDSKGIARAERLAFVNRDKQLNISVVTDKEKYLPREKVKMTLFVKDERGLPMPANLSMAVVNDQLLSFADDKSGNILSQLLLQQDLKEKIEEPDFYFTKKESKSLKALDYVMMTSGWRRFTWEKLIEEELPRINYLGQKALIGGTVLDAYTQKPLAEVKIKDNSGTEFTTDANGKFCVSKLDLSNPTTLVFNSNGYSDQSHYINDYNQNLVVYMYNYNSKHYRQNVPMAGAAIDEDRMVMMEAGDLNEVQIAKAAPHVKFAKRINEKAGSVAGIKKDAFALVDDDKTAKKVNREKEIKVISAGSIVAADIRAERFKGDVEEEEVFNKQVVAENLYYRAREFSAPNYEKQQIVDVRSDFRNTIYWNPNIEIGYSGRKTIEFYNSDDITSFKTIIEGISNDGMIGRAEKLFFTQLPFQMSTKIPVEVATEDLLSIPLTLKNNTDKPLGGALTVLAPVGLKEIGKVETIQTIMPGKSKTIYLDYKVLDKIGEDQFTISFKSCGLSDAFTQKIKIAAKGFPAQISFSSQDVEKEYTFEIKNVVNGSLKASFTAFPNVVSDLMKGVEGILQEPYGCFEQTSCTAYPNAMVLDYLKNTDSKDSKTLARATDLLDRGYKRLTSFETSNKGYEWFGANPAHEGLTAYGIMEFMDMKKAGQEIDQKMLDRTALWLLNHRDGKGGFEREKRALHDFGRINNDILNAYIVYALAEAGYTDIKKEFESSFEKAISLKDPYMLAMMTNAAYSMNQLSKGNEALKLLLTTQEKNGSFNGTTHSITYSQGNSLIIETTALSIMAILKAPTKDIQALNNAVQYLISVRSGSGVFSSTQGTILSLKALTEFAKFSKKTTEDGTIVIYIDNKKVSEQHYKAGDKGAITVNGLEQYIKTEGAHTLKIKYVNVKTPLPYSVAIDWNTFLPNSDKECSIDLKTKLSSKTSLVGETVRLSTTITNKLDKEVPSTMAIIGIPAGFTAQAWQLKELQEKNVFDYYEIKGNNITVYYRGMGPNSVKVINLDLKAEIPGEYDAPASSAYLYYTNEFKTWSAIDKVSIRKSAM